MNFYKVVAGTVNAFGCALLSFVGTAAASRPSNWTGWEGFALLLSAVGVMAIITYHNAWGTIAERDRGRFPAVLALYSILPALIGAVLGVLAVRPGH